jgi:hypothetical protein
MVDPVIFEFTDLETDYANSLGKFDLIDSLVPGWYKDVIVRKKKYEEEEK